MKKTCLNRLTLLYLSIVKKKSVKLLSSYEVGPQGGQPSRGRQCRRTSRDEPGLSSFCLWVPLGVVLWFDKLEFAGLFGKPCAIELWTIYRHLFVGAGLDPPVKPAEFGIK